MSFGDIKGQDRAIEILREGILKNRIFSNYLFVGPDGIGKFEVAKNFAKAVNCLNNSAKADPCEECASCRKINLQTHPDVFFVEPRDSSTSIGIGEIRNIIAKANLKPYEAKKKVFIINDAHSMNTEASNAFLKTLEEAPRDTIFILISRSPGALLPTILSRSHAIKFFPVSPETIRMKEEDLIKRKQRIIDSLMKKDFREEISVYSGREELKENLEFIISYLRDIFLYKAVKEEAIVFHLDRLDEIRSECKRFTQDQLDYLIKKIITLRSYVDYNVNPKVIVDVVCNEIKRSRHA